MSLSRVLKAYCIVGCAAFGVLTGSHAVGQEYPARPVRMVVAYGAGGGADALARTVSEALTQQTGQTFVVENRPGAGGIPAADMVSKATPDGYTVLLTDTQYVITPALFAKLPFDPRHDLVGVSLMTRVPFFFAVKTSAGIDTLQQFIDLAKANPGKYNYGSAGIGSLHHIAMESFKTALNLDITHVPYKGSGQSIVGFIGGETTVTVASLPSILPYIKQGTVKLLGVTSAQRWPQTPDVISIAEYVPNFDFTTELGIMATRGTPPAAIAKLSKEIAVALKRPEVVDRINNVMGAAVVGSTPEAYTSNISQNLERYATAVKVSGAKVQ
ncbi:Bug family tripartite tricarboxylate transporter substrate binding protein [Pigmentiphaga litoralis]|uniref:Bug family tripartite tricarboxylate transporter substrate binding protein n=1 Tax=Pigmentiphaga litoralis TaxID=516702 RepID=UPI001677FACB|nr:tripartite tricarboxylate transporter substrate-binding protein [Pigmentiphaga litoralis]